MHNPNRKSLSSARAHIGKERADEGDLQGNQYERRNSVHQGGLEGTTMRRGVKVDIVVGRSGGGPSGRTEKLPKNRVGELMHINSLNFHI